MQIEDQKFKDILGHIVSLSSSWATWDSPSSRLCENCCLLNLWRINYLKIAHTYTTKSQEDRHLSQVQHFQNWTWPWWKWDVFHLSLWLHWQHFLSPLWILEPKWLYELTPLLLSQATSKLPRTPIGSSFKISPRQVLITAPQQTLLFLQSQAPSPVLI